MRMNEQAQSDDDADRSVSGPEDEDDGGYAVANGRPSSLRAIPDHKHRSASSSIHDRRNITTPSVGSSSTTSRPPSSNGTIHNNSATSHLSIPPFASPYGATPSSSSAKESFLNYFFGGSEMSNPGMRTGRERSSLPGIGRSGDNPLSGRRGLEGNAAAFDMKSLDKHLEAVRSRRFQL